jgi:hypothetical protein
MNNIGDWLIAVAIINMVLAFGLNKIRNRYPVIMKLINTLSYYALRIALVMLIPLQLYVLIEHDGRYTRFILEEKNIFIVILMAWLLCINIGFFPYFICHKERKEELSKE